MLSPLRPSAAAAFGFILAAAAAFGQARVVSADLCIYGGTSGGVVAAVQASRLGLTAVIVEPGRHLGGMTAGGLSWTDVGSGDRVGAVGGLARELYQAIGARYGEKPGTIFGAPLAGTGLHTNDWSKPPSLAFEPKVAEAVFGDWARAAHVAVYFGQRLTAVHRDGRRITEMVTADGTVFRGGMFLDATYEGDLLARAGVTYTLGREANAQYGETLNGIQPIITRDQFEVPVDPYVIPGDPRSGPLPYLLQTSPWGEPGTADRRIQSYNYRVCLTDDPANRLAIDPPPGYNPANYELLARWTESRVAMGEKLTVRSYVKYDPLPHHKWDFNNRWPISTDFIGGADGYPEADEAGRRAIARAHEDYLRGFLHFLATSPRMPESVREEMGRFGLCRDEFTDTGGWPHQLYVREARRMVGDFVMTEHEVRGQRLAKASVGLGAYGIDSHEVRRLVWAGVPTNEAQQAAAVPRPYPIGYGAIVPRAAECENLFVTFALSASHVAFASIRMEPVFMTLSQSAATAAWIALTDKVPVQRVSYAKLRRRLLKDKVALDWPPPSAGP